jgi:comEA protein
MKFFTKSERNVVLFLSITFLIGFGILQLQKEDEQGLIFVGVDEEVAEIIDEQSDFTLKISINDSDRDDLVTLPGIGPSTAEKIVKYREEVGRFNSIEELMKVKGIGPKTFEKLKEFIDI